MVPRTFLVAVALVAAGSTVAAPVAAQTPLADVGAKRILSFSDIKARVDRAVGGRLIGSDYDPESFTYQLRYMRGTEVVDVVVDARSGRILGRRESM